MCISPTYAANWGNTASGLLLSRGMGICLVSRGRDYVATGRRKAPIGRPYGLMDAMLLDNGYWI